MSMQGIARRIVAPVAQRLRLMVSRGVVKLINDAKKCQELQVELLSDELQDDVERFQEFGFTSTPLVDAEALFLSVGANRSHGVVVCVNDRRYRPKNLPAGAVGLHNTVGLRVYLNPTTDVVHLGAEAAADFVALAADVKAELDLIKAELDVLNTHEHSVTAACTAGGISGPTATTGGPAVSYTAGTVAAAKVKAT